MHLRLQREILLEGSTLGTLCIDGKLFCYTLEDTDRQLEFHPERKIPKETAIPKGNYTVRLSMSQRFQKILPEVLEVPGYSGVRIHSGNYPGDTEGCILVGEKYSDSMITKSKATLGALLNILGAATSPITLEVC